MTELFKSPYQLVIILLAIFISFISISEQFNSLREIERDIAVIKVIIMMQRDKPSVSKKVMDEQ
jgi:hypothetical protein